MRKYYIDNIRIVIILLLFPVHTLMIWNDFGNTFYIWEGSSRLLSTLLVMVNPWMMPVLFAFAGISAGHSLRKRSSRQFITERTKKLCIPFVSGLILLVPVQTLFARKFFYGYTGDLLDNLVYFFTHITDMTGYDGCFTPGQLWFILFLFIISLLFILIRHFFPYEECEKYISDMNIWLITAMFIPISVMYYTGNFGSFSLGKCLAVFLLGYYVLSNETILDTLEKNLNWLATVFLFSQLALGCLYYTIGYYGDWFVNFIAWMGIMTITAAGRKYLNRNSAFTEYFAPASYPIYIFHQTILVVIAYYAVTYLEDPAVQIPLIMVGSFILTVACYETVRRVPYIRNLFGISGAKKPDKNS